MRRVFVTGGSGFLGRTLLPALREQGYSVRGLAVAASDAEAVRRAGAEPIAGDLDDEQALRAGMDGCELVIHAAARLSEWGTLRDFMRVNVEGTAHVLTVARQTGVARLLYVSTDSVLVGGPPMIGADETWPLPARPLGYYAHSKGLAERRVLAANSPALTTLVVRPCWLWGSGDTSTLPGLAAMVRQGQFRWIGGGRHLTSTCHVANACEGIVLAAERGRGGNVYFVTDGPPITYRDFVTAMLQTQGLRPGNRDMPRWMAAPIAWGSELAWRRLHLKGSPPLTPAALRLISEQRTINDAKARRELGYTGAVSRDAGFAAMAQASR